MTRRSRPPRPASGGGLLDWSDSRHWGGTPRPCRYCGKPTPLLDSKRSPAHKSCAEEALAQQAAAYENGIL